MDCEKVRDRFSSLWEKELAPFDEKEIKEHLSLCPECQREYEQFEKTMRWLHSVGEVEVPDEFLPGLYKKMEERKRIRPTEAYGKRWFNFPISLKLPIQAAAMVTVVFLVLYLTKMMPKSPSPVSLEKRPEQVLTQKETERARRALGTFPATTRPIDVGQTKARIPGGGKVDAGTPQVMAEEKRAETPSRKTEALAFKQTESKKAARASAPSPEPVKIEKELLTKKPVAATKPPQEIILRISDREKAASQLRELVKQFKGEIVATEGNGLLASLPAGLFSEFEKELVRISSTGRTDKGIARKYTAEGLRASQEVGNEAVEERSGERAKPVTDEESRIVVRILLVQE
jgi:hypothetical protein